MATRDEVYQKFGITAEAAQLFEPELGSLLLIAQGIRHGWPGSPDQARTKALLDRIDRITLGQLLNALKSHVQIDADLADRFVAALRARNSLNHGFFERHNFSIQSDEGRTEIYADLEDLHDQLFQAWRIASVMTEVALKGLGKNLRVPAAHQCAGTETANERSGCSIGCVRTKLLPPWMSALSDLLFGTGPTASGPILVVARILPNG